jgi:hypothetical protein
MIPEASSRVVGRAEERLDEPNASNPMRAGAFRRYI